MRFDGRCVLVTGATSGIGAATAKAFAAEGASVVISGRNAERAAGVIAEAGETPAAIVFIAADLRDESAYETLIADMTDCLGRLDVLVNNAGILHRAGSLETTPEQWAEAMAVNVIAPFYLSRAAARGMKAQGGGAIVNVSSELGLYADAGTTSYCTTKGALVQLTRAMALDFAAEKIRINCVCPGRTLTPLLVGAMTQWGVSLEEGLARRREWMPMKRIAEADEIARVILFSRVRRRLVRHRRHAVGGRRNLDRRSRRRGQRPPKRRGAQPGRRRRMNFEGKAVLVTGGATGIGKATAIAFADAGARVLTASRDAARGAAFADEMQTAGRAIEFARCDLLDDGAPEALIAEALRRLGRLDVLFNNAGIHHRYGTLATTNAHWAETMTLNVGAVFMCSREAAAVMKDQGGGVIVNMASDLGIFAEPEKVSYCTSKAAVVQMTKAMALDLAPHNIRVTAIAPGDTFTPMIEHKIGTLGLSLEDGLAWLSAPVAMKRLADTAEIARAVLFLASDDASYVTGTTLSVDGGTSASGPGGQRPRTKG